MLDPTDCGPAFIGLPQDIQEIAYDYPEEFFEPTLWTIPRARPDRDQVEAAAALLKTAQKPLIISGGGVRYSGAEEALAKFAADRGIPMAETIAGKGAVVHDHPAYVGAIGIEGTDAAKELAENADVVIAVGTRLQDFTTGSWTTFARDTVSPYQRRRFDARKHRSLPVVGDALECIGERTQRWATGPAILRA